MSLGSLLSIARSALMVQQRAMEVSGHNVANANTPGYSRQTLQVQAANPLQLPLYSLGRGVEANQITRARDSFYDASYRQDNGSLGRSNTLNSYLSQVETTLNEPSTSGFSNALDGLFGSLSDLSLDPASHANRALVVSNANRVVQQLNSLGNQVAKLRQQAGDNLRVQIESVNSLTQQIADLNQKVVASNGPGGASSDLMDQRDMLVDKLSAFVDVHVIQNSDGSLNITAGDTSLVDNAQFTALQMVPAGSGLGVAPVSGGPAIALAGGTMAALTDLTQNRLPAVAARLDQIANALVTEFNNRHRAGYTPTGATNIDFFDPAGTSASTIRLSTALSTSADNLAVSANNVPGNGDVATALANLATTGVASLGGSTMRESFVTLASDIGLDVNNSQKDIDAQQVLVDRDDQARNSVSGVNVDEEMVSLITQQQAYQAAARIVTVAQQMMETMLQIM